MNTIFLKKGGLLEQYKKNIVMAFSYYKLFSTSKKCVRVRRSSDNSEQDFGFVNNYIDINGILSFCGSGSGYVKTWHNQFLGGNYAVQSVSGNQPRIVNSGVFDVSGLKFSAGQYFTVLDYSDIDIINPFLGIYCNFNSLASTGYVISKLLNGTSTSQFYILFNASNVLQQVIGTTLSIATDFNTQIKSYITWINKSSSGLIANVNFNNSNYVSTGIKDTSLVNYDKITIGARHNTGDVYATFFNGSIKTIVISNNSIPYNKLQEV